MSMLSSEEDEEGETCYEEDDLHLTKTIVLTIIG